MAAMIMTSCSSKCNEFDMHTYYSRGAQELYARTRPFAPEYKLVEIHHENYSEVEKVYTVFGGLYSLKPFEKTFVNACYSSIMSETDRERFWNADGYPYYINRDEYNQLDAKTKRMYGELYEPFM